MSTFLYLIKQYMLTTISVVITLLALTVLCYGVFVSGPSTVDAMNERVQKPIGQIQQIRNTTVRVPSKQIDMDWMPKQVTPNEKIIQDLEGVNKHLESQYKKIQREVQAINQKNRQPLKVRLFPESDRTTRREARYDYRDRLLNLLEPFNNNTGVGLNAGLPFTPDEQKLKLEEVKREFYTVRKIPQDRPIDQLTRKEQRDLKLALNTKLLEAIRQRAQNHGIYVSHREIPNIGMAIGGAEATEGNTGNTTQIASEYPIAVPNWIYHGDPAIEDIWESQVNLWAYQDIVRAMVAMNNTNDQGGNILQAPIKQLIRLEAVPGYVGKQTKGGVVGATNSSGETPDNNTGAAGYNVPGQAVDPLSLTPTGRISNDQYDVRHMKLAIIMDITHLPEFYEQLKTVGFMTVLRTEISPINEFDMLKMGYDFGPPTLEDAQKPQGDIVRVDMVIETIWQREWTVGKGSAEETGYMPASVRRSLGIGSTAAPMGGNTMTNPTPGTDMPADDRPGMTPPPPPMQ